MCASPHRHWIAGVLLVCAIFACNRAVNAQPRPAVVELFTSEGCSSCPPAEAYLGELAQRRDVIALAFHVDYWDDLGWRDQFGLAEAVQRQRTYAKTLRRSSAYTPQVVIDGQRSRLHRREFGGASRWRRNRALGTRRPGPHRPRRADKRGRERYRARGLPASGSLCHRAGRECRTNARRVQYRACHPHPWAVGWQSAAVPNGSGFIPGGCHGCCRPRAARRSGAYYRGGGPYTALDPPR